MCILSSVSVWSPAHGAAVVKQRDRGAPRPVAAAAQHVDAGVGDDQRRVAGLQHLPRARDVGAVAAPQLGEGAADGFASVRGHAAGVHEHRAVVEQVVEPCPIALRGTRLR